MANSEKHVLVDESIEMIGDKYNELCYKHDGCRVLQALIKYGNKPQRILVIEKLKDNFLHLMQQKYSHYLASRMYTFAPLEEQKAFFRKVVSSQSGKLIQHAYASEVIEYIYSTGTSEEEKREMVFGLYGNYTLVLREVLSKFQNASLKQFM